MVLFVFALVVAALGVAGYAHYNPGVHDISLRSYDFAGVPDWVPIAVGAGVPLTLFLLHAIYAAVRVRTLRRANERLASEAPGYMSPRQAPGRSWTTSGE